MPSQIFRSSRSWLCRMPDLPGPNLFFQFGFTDEPCPMPRFWLSSEDGAIVVQIQKNAFLPELANRADAYPHFNSVRGLFDKYFDHFSAFVRSELKIEAVNIRTTDFPIAISLSPAAIGIAHWIQRKCSPGWGSGRWHRDNWPLLGFQLSYNLQPANWRQIESPMCLHERATRRQPPARRLW